MATAPLVRLAGANAPFTKSATFTRG
jgi:hypothetical protein